MYGRWWDLLLWILVLLWIDVLPQKFRWVLIRAKFLIMNWVMIILFNLIWLVKSSFFCITIYFVFINFVLLWVFLRLYFKYISSLWWTRILLWGILVLWVRWIEIQLPWSKVCCWLSLWIEGEGEGIRVVELEGGWVRVWSEII